MSHYNYLKIDFYGQFNDDTIHKLTYPEPFNPMEASALVWLNPITDPRAIRTLFPLAKYGYRVHRDANGTYYSLLTRYERDARQGCVAITVMIGAQHESVINGKAIFDLLNLLKTNVLDTDNITATAVEHCLIASKMPLIDVAPISIAAVPSLSGQAMRVYGSNEHLYEIFQFPKQQEYDQYGEVFLINKFWCHDSVPGVALLTSPIIKTHNVADTLSHNAINTGDDTLLAPTAKKKQQPALSRWLLPFLTFLLGAAIAAGITWFLMKDSSNGIIEPSQAIELSDTAILANQEHDIGYLNGNVVWKADSLKSARFKHFINSFASGNVKDIIKGIEHIKAAGKPVNPVLISIAEKIKQDPKTAKEVIMATDAKTIDLDKISKELSGKVNKAVVPLPANERPVDAGDTSNNGLSRPMTNSGLTKQHN